MHERPDVQSMSDDEREAFLGWLESNDIDPEDVADDGQFSVHDDYVTGNKFTRDHDGNKSFYKNRAVTYHFKKHVKGNWR
jgi:hypothetical protein